jgi:hypothetical protein
MRIFKKRLKKTAHLSSTIPDQQGSSTRGLAAILLDQVGPSLDTLEPSTYVAQFGLHDSN